MGFSKLYKDLLREEKETEKLEENEKEVLRACSSAIKYIHNGNLKKAEKLIEKAYKIIKQTDWQCRTIAMQEFVEAYLFLNIEKEGKLLPYPIKGTTAKSYIYGVLDLVGELKRAFISALLKGDEKKAKLYFNLMKEIYDESSQIVVSNKTLPEFRRKLDIARIQLDQAFSLLVKK